MTTEAESGAVELRQAALLYRLLSRVFLEEPDAEFLRQMFSGEAGELLLELGFDVLGDISNLPPEAQVAELECEYARLFVGPGPHISPCESVLRGEGRHWGDHTVAVNKCYHASRFVVKDNATEMPDHAGVQFEFVAQLLEREQEAHIAKDDKAAAKAADTRRRFIADHILVWLPELHEQVRQSAKFSFYREFSRFALEWVNQDMREAT